MTRLPESAVLVLPGEGKKLAKCRKLARKLGISHRVRFPGYVQDMAPWYAMANAAVSASRSEGLPFNIMEAMYFGLPVVASDAKGHTDLIRHRETGLLFPLDDPAACAGQIRCLTEDPRLADRMSQAARREVAQYGLSAVQPRVMELYRQSLNGR
jgi:glycosyltransferase EpsD